MKVSKSSAGENNNLRSRAEERLNSCGQGQSKVMTKTDSIRLNHELQVYQIELEMQNSELQRSLEVASDLLEKFTDLYDFAPVSYVSLSRDSVVLRLNLACATLLKSDRSFLIGRNFRNHVTKEARSAFDIFIEKAFESRTKVSFETELLKGASKLNVIIEGVTSDKRDECRLSIVDITERKQAESLLRESESRFRQMFDILPMGIGIGEIKSGLIIEANDCWLQLLGDEHNEVPGQNSAGLDIYVDIEAREEIVKIIMEKGEIVNHAIKFRRSTGELLNLLYSGNIIFRNSIPYLLVMLVDVTRHQQMESELAENELKYRTLANSGQALVWTSDTEKLCTYFNEPWLSFTGRSLEQELGNGWAEGVHPEDFDRCLQTYFTAFDKRERFSIEYRLRHASGEYRWIQDVGAPRFDTKGDFMGYIGHCLDITERIQAQEEKEHFRDKLFQTDKMASLGLLAAGVAHEINNPNNYIMFNSELLAKVWQSAMPLLKEYFTEHGDFKLGSFSFSEAHEIIPRLFSGLVDGSERIGNIVKKMQNYTRQDSREQNEQVDVNNVVKDSISILDHEIKKYCHNFELKTENKLPTTLCNPQQLAQVLINLILNALQSLPDKKHGIITSTSLNAAGDQISISVEDQGKGMSAEVLEHLAEPFFTTRAYQGGTGLGLYVSKAILQQNCGSLSFASEPGKGTTATVLLPVCKAENPEKSVTDQI